MMPRLLCFCYIVKKHKNKDTQKILNKVVLPERDQSKKIVDRMVNSDCSSRSSLIRGAVWFGSALCALPVSPKT